MRECFDVAVVGAGVSGLSAAFEAERAGASVVVLEAGDNAGGVLRTARIDGFLVERGPNTFAVSQHMRSVLDGLGLAGDIIEPLAAAKRRYIMRGGTLHALPHSPPALLASPLFTWGGKLRALCEPLVPRAKRNAFDEESLASLVRRRLGNDVLNYVVDPLVSGVYAGDTEKLSSRYALRVLAQLEEQHGSILVGAMRAGRNRSHIVSFREGLEQLPLALARALRTPVRTGTRAVRIDHDAECWTVGLESPAGFQDVSATSLVLALPAHALTQIAAPSVFEGALQMLAGVHYAPVATVALGFARASVAHALDGFGVLIPSAEKRGVLGALFNSTMFPDRAPDGQVLLTAFIGGARCDRLPAGEDLVRIAVSELQSLLGISGPPTMVLATSWERGIPQFNLGHGKVLEHAATLERTFPGLVLTGSYLHGVSLGDCMTDGFAAGGRAAALLRRMDRA